MFGTNALQTTLAPEDSNVQAPPDEDEVRGELDRILRSTQFTQSDRLGRFLRFTVDYALSGKGHLLKEYLIGVSVYDRRPPYHPSQDSIVRTEARRLRAKLKEYYESEGKDSSLFLYYRPGNYTPLFRKKSSTIASECAGTDLPNTLLAEGAGVCLAVLPFADLSANPLSAQCARALTDELTHALTMTDGLRVVSTAVVEKAMSGDWDIRSLTASLNVLSAIEGNVRIEGSRLKVTIHVVNRDGFQSSSHRFETIADPAALAQVQEQIVSAFISRGRPLQSSIRKRKASAGALTMAVYPLVIQAETLLNEGSSADLHPAILKFQEAIEVAPLFARSYCGLAQCQIDLALRGATPSQDVVGQALSAAAKAVQLDPEMFGCYSTLATANALAWRWDDACRQFALASDLGVHAPTSRQYALFLAALGRFEEGAEHLALAQRVDPFSYRQKVARAKFLFLAERFDDILALERETPRYGDEPLECLLIRGLAAAHLCLRGAASQCATQIEVLADHNRLLLTYVAEILALAGEYGRAARLVDGYQLLDPSSRVSDFRKALLALALQRETECLDLLHGARMQHEAELVWLRVDPRFSRIRATSGYANVIAEVFSPV